MNILPIPYLEMELCDRSREEVPKPMGVEEAASIIFDLAKGLRGNHTLKRSYTKDGYAGKSI